MSLNPKRARRAAPILAYLTPIAAAVSVINVAISMFTNEWLRSYERIPPDIPNPMNREEFKVKRTVSGLWKLCWCICANITTNETESNCFPIDYFAKERYTSEPHDSTMAIPYAVTKAGPLFIVAGVLLVSGIFSATLGHIWRKKRIGIFVGGIIFIVAGLIILIGLVVYLSVLQAEIGPKLRPRNSLDSPQFMYSYGISFILIVVGFLSTELTGTSAIFQYIYLHQIEWAMKADPEGENVRNSNSRQSSCHDHPRSSQMRNPHPHSVLYHKSKSGQPYGCKKHGHMALSYFPPPPTASTPRCNSHHYPGSLQRCRKSYQGNHGHFFDDTFDMDVPIPPPPPIPRDITCTTTVSDYFFGDHPGPPTASRERDRERLRDRRTTPV